MCYKKDTHRKRDKLQTMTQHPDNKNQLYPLTCLKYKISQPYKAVKNK
jgi:hypothetical protein